MPLLLGVPAVTAFMIASIEGLVKSPPVQIQTALSLASGMESLLDSISQLPTTSDQSEPKLVESALLKLSWKLVSSMLVLLPMVS